MIWNIKTQRLVFKWRSINSNLNLKAQLPAVDSTSYYPIKAEISNFLHFDIQQKKHHVFWAANVTFGNLNLNFLNRPHKVFT